MIILIILYNVSHLPRISAYPHSSVAPQAIYPGNSQQSQAICTIFIALGSTSHGVEIPARFQREKSIPLLCDD